MFRKEINTNMLVEKFKLEYVKHYIIKIKNIFKDNYLIISFSHNVKNYLNYVHTNPTF